jgi:quinol monooxygenase YgiN
LITMTIVAKVRPEKREEFLQAVLSLTGDREKQEGLKKSELHQEIGDRTGFILIYEWETQEDCKRYLGGEKFSVLLGALDLLCEKSEIRCSHLFDKLPNLACGA